MKIVVIGTIYVDIKGFPIGHFDPTGRNVGSVAEFHGGVGRNIAQDIANIGATPIFVSSADNTGTGEDVVSGLKTHGVDTSYVAMTPDGMGTWLAVFDTSGDVYASVSKRPNLMPIYDTLKAHGDEIFSNADSVLVEMDIDDVTVDLAFQLAAKYNKKVYGVISNMNIALERMDYIRQTDCFICNQQEAGIFFAEDSYEAIAPKALVKVLPTKVAAAGLKSMVVTMGAAGSIYVDHDGTCGICPPEIVDVADTTGAGDGFFAGTCTGLTAGKNLGDACKLGTKVAASVISSTENVCAVLTGLL